MFLTADQITRLMTNHPNRNWRRAMHSAADSHLAGSQVDGQPNSDAAAMKGQAPRAEH